MKLTEVKHTSDADAFLKRCAKNVAETMMAHYFNHNIVTDGWEINDEHTNFSDEELSAASQINLTDPEFKRLVIQAVSEEIQQA